MKKRSIACLVMATRPSLIDDYAGYSIDHSKRFKTIAQN